MFVEFLLNLMGMKLGSLFSSIKSTLLLDNYIISVNFIFYLYKSRHLKLVMVMNSSRLQSVNSIPCISST